MNWLINLFKSDSPKNLKGVYLEHPKWKISVCRDFSKFFRVLPKIAPENSILYLEGGSLRKELIDFFESRKIEPIIEIAEGNVLPKSLCVHMPINPENLEELADLSERYAGPEIADHIHVYKEGRVLIQWYDALSDPIFFLKKSGKIK